MDLRLDGALGPIEGNGKLGVGQPIDVAEDDWAPVRGWQLGDQGGPPPAGFAPFNHSRRRSGRIGGRFGKRRPIRRFGVE
jgi:hypothetical protein